MLEAGKLKMKELNQVCVVVKDLDKSMEQYLKILGVGPWQVYTYAPPDLKNTTVRGKPEPYSMKLALAMIGPVMLELIQPLKGKSHYKEFLEKRGEGLHHIAAFRVEDIDEVIAHLKKQGIGVLMSGEWHGGRFAYMDTEKQLGTVVELVWRPGPRPPPERTYP